MSQLVCAISGVVPEEPVFCAHTGFLYERRLIQKHIETSGVCPVSRLPLKKDDLLDVKAPRAARPRPVTAASIPGLLSLFQSEWDSTMTEVFKLKQHLETARQQLSQSLYQQDAATRVIARLLRERDNSRQQVHALQQQVLQLQKRAAAAAAGDGLLDGEEEPGISESLVQQMQVLAKQLLAARKKRHVENVLPPSKAAHFRCTYSLPLHSSADRGVTCCEWDPTHPTSVIASGGCDGYIVLFDLQQQKTLAKLAGHSKAVRSIKLVPAAASAADGAAAAKSKAAAGKVSIASDTSEDSSSSKQQTPLPVIVSASDDKTVRIWKVHAGDAQANYRVAATIRKHRGEVTCLSIHPLGDFFASCAADRSWAFSDLREGRCLQMQRNLSCQYKCLSFHPDGMILGGGGVDGSVHIWDMKGLAYRAALSGHTGPINQLSFSENGYYLATASSDGTVRLWDLRKSLSFQTIHVKDSNPHWTGPAAEATCVCFDQSGQYVACGSSNRAISLYYFEARASAANVVNLLEHTDRVMDIKIGEGTAMLLSASMDRTVRVWEPEEPQHEEEEEEEEKDQQRHHGAAAAEAPHHHHADAAEAAAHNAKK